MRLLTEYINNQLLFENVILNNKIKSIIDRLSDLYNKIDIIIEAINNSSAFSITIKNENI